MRRRFYLPVTLLLLASLFGGCAGPSSLNAPNFGGGSTPGGTTGTPGAPAAPGATTGTLEVHFIDVGQADSILLIQGDHAMLVDAGNNGDASAVTGYLTSHGIKRLEVVVGTHPHEDHIGSLDKVIQSFEVEQVIMPKVTSTTQTFTDVIAAIKAKSLTITTPRPGATFKLGEAAVTILAPSGTSYEDTNNYSVVLQVVYGKTAFLLTGDAEDISESEMLRSGSALKSDVLKVGHHGSNSSTSDAFLEKVAPAYAVISVGVDNTYGHPAPATLQKLKERNIRVYRTDESGTVVAVSNGSAITFKTERGE